MSVEKKHKDKLKNFEALNLAMKEGGSYALCRVSKSQ